MSWAEGSARSYWPPYRPGCAPAGWIQGRPGEGDADETKPMGKASNRPDDSLSRSPRVMATMNVDMIGNCPGPVHVN